MYCVTGCLQHADSSPCILRLEPAVEGINQQNHFPVGFRDRYCGLCKGFTVPRWQRTLSGKSEQRFGHVLRHVQHRREASRPRCIARQVSNQPFLQGQAMVPAPVMEKLDFHFRHVDAGRAFTLATLARHAKFQRLAHRSRRQPVVAQLPGQRQPQRVGTAACQVLFVAGDAV